MSNVAVLHSYFRSSCSWRVRIALNYKQIQYKQKAVHLLNNGGEQHSDEYKSVNPMEQVCSEYIVDIVKILISCNSTVKVIF